jgi:hypothetical protein
LDIVQAGGGGCSSTTSMDARSDTPGSRGGVSFVVGKMARSQQALLLSLPHSAAALVVRGGARAQPNQAESRLYLLALDARAPAACPSAHALARALGRGKPRAALLRLDRDDSSQPLQLQRWLPVLPVVFPIKCRIRLYFNQIINRNSAHRLIGEQLRAAIHFHPRAVLEDSSGDQNLTRYEPSTPVCRSNEGGSACDCSSCSQKMAERLRSYIAKNTNRCPTSTSQCAGHRKGYWLLKSPLLMSNTLLLQRIAFSIHC